MGVLCSGRLEAIMIIDHDKQPHSTLTPIMYRIEYCRPTVPTYLLISCLVSVLLRRSFHSYCRYSGLLSLSIFNFSFPLQ